MLRTSALEGRTVHTVNSEEHASEYTMSEPPVATKHTRTIPALTRSSSLTLNTVYTPTIHNGELTVVKIDTNVQWADCLTKAS